MKRPAPAWPVAIRGPDLDHVPDPVPATDVVNPISLLGLDINGTRESAPMFQRRRHLHLMIRHSFPFLDFRLSSFFKNMQIITKGRAKKASWWHFQQYSGFFLSVSLSLSIKKPSLLTHCKNNNNNNSKKKNILKSCFLSRL